jgi:hypothetical protein
MTAAAWRDHLMAQQPVPETLQFLDTVFIRNIVDRLNEPPQRRRMALYHGERVPENQTNLTDVRNRVSLLFEYTIGWVANEVLADNGINDLFWTNVVANRFPDLEVRDSSGTRGLRLEVKCIECVAEEPAANFDTMKKDLHPDTDYVAVFVWEWCK